MQKTWVVAAREGPGVAFQSWEFDAQLEAMAWLNQLRLKSQFNVFFFGEKKEVDAIIATVRKAELK